MIIRDLTEKFMFHLGANHVGKVGPPFQVTYKFASMCFFKIKEEHKIKNHHL